MNNIQERKVATSQYQDARVAFLCDFQDFEVCLLGGEIVSMKVKVIDLSLFVKMSKVELGDWQLVAIRELPVVVRPS